MSDRNGRHDVGRSRQVVSDEDIDHAVRRLVRAHPSPAFSGNVMRRVRDEGRRKRGLDSARFPWNRGRLLVPLAAAAALVLAAAGAWLTLSPADRPQITAGRTGEPGDATPPRDDARSAQAGSPTQAPRAGAESAGVGSGGAQRADSANTVPALTADASRRSRPPQQTFRLLARRGRAAGGPGWAAGLTATELAAIDSLPDVPPLEVTPLTEPPPVVIAPVELHPIDIPQIAIPPVGDPADRREQMPAHDQGAKRPGSTLPKM